MHTELYTILLMIKLKVNNKPEKNVIIKTKINQWNKKNNNNTGIREIKNFLSKG